MFGGQNYDGMLVVLGGLRLGENFGINAEEGCARSIQNNVRFGYQLSICPRTEEEPRKILIEFAGPCNLRFRIDF